MTDSEIDCTRKQFFNDSAEKWIDTWYRDPRTGEHDKHAGDFKRLFSMIPLRPGDYVLDAGCGTGVLVPYILNAIGDNGVLCELDYAKKMIDENRNLHWQNNIRFIVSDVGNIQLPDDSCDAAVCFSCFPHFQDKPKAIGAFWRVLKPQGILVIAHFASSEGIKRHHQSCHAVMHDHLPAEDIMRAMIGQGGFNIEIFIDEDGYYYIEARKNRP